jgi:hypothetical protein
MSLVADERCDILCLDLPRAEELRRRQLVAATNALRHAPAPLPIGLG